MYRKFIRSRLSLKHIAEGGSLVEEIVSTIRTAQAFGTQNALASLYDVVVQKTYYVDRRGAVAQGIGLSCFFFSMYAAYGLGAFCSLFIPTNSLTSTYNVPSVQLWHHPH
jgi:ATP-binding cassette subfamily B (MDR/TAP) protein 1